MSVFVVGSVNADLTLPVRELPAPGATVAARESIRAGGGKGANVAVAAARAGVAVRLVAAVGNDLEGRAACAELEREGVDTSCVVAHDDVSTGLAVICVDGQGENTVVVSAGANDRLGPADVRGALKTLTPDDVCVVNFEIPDRAVLTAAQAVQERGARLVVNPSPVRPIGRLAEAHPTMVLNAVELEQLSFGDASGLLASGCAEVVTTLGGEGACVTTADGSESIRPFPADPVDTTGAGDAFTGAFAAALAEGARLVAAATRGSAAGALATRALGARAAMPRRAEIDRVAQT